MSTHTHQERGRHDQPPHRAVVGVVTLDLGDERVQDEDLDQPGDGQIRGGKLLPEPARDPLGAWWRFHGAVPARRLIGPGRSPTVPRLPPDPRSGSLGPLRASTFRATSRGPAATVGGRAVLPAMAARSIHGSRRSAGLGWFQSSTVNPSWVDRTRIWEWTKTGTKTGGAPRRASTACSWRSQQPVLTITVRLPSARASSDIAGAWVWPDTNTAISRREGVPAIGGGRRRPGAGGWPRPRGTALDPTPALGDLAPGRRPHARPSGG